MLERRFAGLALGLLRFWGFVGGSCSGSPQKNLSTSPSCRCFETSQKSLSRLFLGGSTCYLWIETQIRATPQETSLVVSPGEVGGRDGARRAARPRNLPGRERQGTRADRKVPPLWCIPESPLNMITPKEGFLCHRHEATKVFVLFSARIM